MINDKISIAAMVKYEKLTGGNALELFGKEIKSATDLTWMAFMIKYTQDKTTTFEQIENLSTDDFQALIKSASEQQ